MASGVKDPVGPAQRHGGQAMRFGMVGVLNTLVDFTVYAVGVAAGLAPVAANIAAFFFANAFSYTANGRITFRKNGAPASLSWRSYRTFVAAHLVSLAISTSMVFALADAIGPIGAKASSMLVTGLINYSASAFLVFRTPKKR